MHWHWSHGTETEHGLMFRVQVKMFSVKSQLICKVKQEQRRESIADGQQDQILTKSIDRASDASINPLPAALHDASLASFAHKKQESIPSSSIHHCCDLSFLSESSPKDNDKNSNDTQHM